MMVDGAIGGDLDICMRIGRRGRGSTALTFCRLETDENSAGAEGAYSEEGRRFMLKLLLHGCCTSCLVRGLVGRHLRSLWTAARMRR